MSYDRPCTGTRDSAYGQLSTVADASTAGANLPAAADTIAAVDGVNLLDQASILANGGVSSFLNGSIKVRHICMSQSLIVSGTWRVQGIASPLLMSSSTSFSRRWEHRKTEEPIGCTQTPSLLQILSSSADSSISLLPPWTLLTLQGAKREPLKVILACSDLAQLSARFFKI